MGRNGESGAVGLAAARGGVELGVGARFARFGTGTGTSNVASDPLRDRTESYHGYCNSAIKTRRFEKRDACARANAVRHGSTD